MNRKHCCLLLLASWVAAGCQTTNVKTEYDHAAAFSKMHTYCWVPPPAWLNNDPRLHMDLVTPLVRQDVEAQLQARGFQPGADCARADFQVTFTAALDEKFAETPDPSNVAIYEYSPGSGGEWFTKSSGGSVKTSRVPSLVIKILQPGSNRVLWRTVASANLQPATSDAQRQQRIQNAVKLIMSKFPPPPSK